MIKSLKQKNKQLSSRLSLINTRHKIKSTEFLQLFVRQNISWRRMQHMRVFLHRFSVDVFPTCRDVLTLRREIYCHNNWRFKVRQPILMIYNL